MTLAANRLRRARELAGLSLAQAAKLLGWAQGPLHAMETGVGNPPSEDDLRSLAALYRCSRVWLLGETAELSDESKALMRDVEHDSDRATLTEFMEMLSTPDPGAPRPAPVAERLARVRAARAATAPPDQVTKLALETAARSLCRSKRGVVVYATSCGEPIIEGTGFNGPPRDAPCPGREVCAGTCGQRCVHAEIRAIRVAGWPRYGGPSELVHVELAAGGGVVACDGPSCPGCAAVIADVGFVGGVWLYLGLHRCMTCRRFEDSSDVGERCTRCPECGSALTAAGVWRRYSAEDFYRITLQRCGMVP